MAEKQSQCHQVSQDVTKVMAGEPVPVGDIDLQRDYGMRFVPMTKKTMNYIVITVLFNEQGQVLMVQEAKRICRGSWYLPAGRLEPKENIVDGAKREVLEESGLECDIITMFSLEIPCGHFMRLNFYGNITGGQLKSPAQQDEESIQAAFFDVNSVILRQINLRKDDIIPVVQQAVQYRQSLASVPLHPNMLPAINSQQHVIHRIVLVTSVGENERLHILSSTSGGKPHIITAAVAPADAGLQTSVNCIMDKLSSEASHLAVEMHGILGVEHCGTEKKDGICITSLVSCNMLPERGLVPIQDETFEWVPVTDQQCVNALQKRLKGNIVKVSNLL